MGQQDFQDFLMAALPLQVIPCTGDSEWMKAPASLSTPSAAQCLTQTPRISTGLLGTAIKSSAQKHFATGAVLPRRASLNSAIYKTRARSP